MKYTYPIILGLLVAGIFTACSNFKTTESGIEYKIISGDDAGKAINSDSFATIFANYQLELVSNDSMLTGTFDKNTPVYIPVNEPNFKDVFMQMSTGDSAVMICNADSFFIRSFGSNKPSWMKEDEKIRFTVKIVDVMNEKEMMKKQQEDMERMRVADSTALNKAISEIPNLQKLPTGVNYVTEKEGKGKAVKKGSKVRVLYRGSFLTGQVFDQNLQEGIEVTVGLGQVIPGWEDVLMQLKEGQKVKAFIPWKEAYGAGGFQSIPPFTSLVFEMEVLKVD